MKRALLVGAMIALSGCATTGTDGVIPIGPDLYMVGGIGGFTDYSSSGVKARYIQDASKYCASKGRVMQPVNTTGQDASAFQYASAEVQFRCLASDDPRLPK